MFLLNMYIFHFEQSVSQSSKILRIVLFCPKALELQKIVNDLSPKFLE